MKDVLETYQVTQYGEYACSCCKKPLIGKCLAVAYESDDEGREWRTFHKECYTKLLDDYLNLSPNQSFEECLYENFPISPAVEDVE